MENENGKHNAKTDVTKSLPLRGLLELLALYKGSIVSSASLDAENIRQAQASGRMYVDENSLGYVWMPEDDDCMPVTPEGVEQFEKWFPLDIEMPESLKNWRPWMGKTKIEKKTPWADNNGRIKHT